MFVQHRGTRLTKLVAVSENLVKRDCDEDLSSDVYSTVPSDRATVVMCLSL
jgi:hypothetical protein